MLFQVSCLALFAFAAVHSDSEFLSEYRQYSYPGEPIANLAPAGSDPFVVSYRIGLAWNFVDTYYFIQHGPEGQSSAIIPADITFDQSSSQLGISSEVGSQIDLQDPNGVAYSFGSINPSALVWERIESKFYWTNKAEPQIVQTEVDGSYVQELTILDYHKSDAQTAGQVQTRGIVGGAGYNAAAMAYAEDAGCRLDVVSQGPLVQDGPAPSAENRGPTPIRITQYNFEGNAPALPAEPLNEFVYMMGPIPDGFDSIVVEDIVNTGLDEGLVLETYHSSETGQAMAQVFRIQYNPALPEHMATDVINEESIAGRVGVDVFPVYKELVFRIDDALLGDNKMVDCLSYMVFGPDLDDGRRLLLIGSDNENLDSPRVFQLLAFAFDPEA